jgi:hypothetical protein
MMLGCFIITAMSGLILLYFLQQNKSRRIERYYFKHNKLLFALLTFVNFLLIVSVVMNGRFIIGELFTIVFSQFAIFRKIMKKMNNI